MSHKELFIDFLNEFQTYIEKWQKLDSIRQHWILRTVLYFPVGMFLEHRVLHMKHKLTEEYSKYLEKYEEMVVEARRLCSERN